MSGPSGCRDEASQSCLDDMSHLLLLGELDHLNYYVADLGADFAAVNLLDNHQFAQAPGLVDTWPRTDDSWKTLPDDSDHYHGDHKAPSATGTGGIPDNFHSSSNVLLEGPHESGYSHSGYYCACLQQPNITPVQFPFPPLLTISANTSLEGRSRVAQQCRP
jgi:hypothetical protein